MNATSAGLARARTALAAAFLAVLLAASWQGFRRGLRMHRAFQRRETVAEAQNWLFSRFPASGAIALDDYVGPVARDVPGTTFSVQRLPEFWPGVRRGQDPDPVPDGGIGFCLRNASFPGRIGNRSPASRRLLPQFASNEAAFARCNVRLAAWRAAPGGPRPVFGQHDVELWGLAAPPGSPGPWRAAPPAGAPEVEVFSARPVRMTETGHAFRGTDTAPGVPLGALDALRIVGKRRTMQPPPPGVCSRVVFFHAEGPAPIAVTAEGKILRGKFRLEPGEAVVAALDEAALAKAAETDPFPGFRVRMRGDDQASLCLGFFARDDDDAARLAAQIGVSRLSGVPAGALARFSAAGADGRAAVAAWRAGTGPEPRVGGVPFGFVEDLARLRLPRVVPYCGRRLPVWLPPGRWSVSAEFVQDVDWRLSCGDALFSGQDGPLVPDPAAAGRNVVRASVVSPPSGLWLAIPEDFAPSPAFAATGISGIEIEWDPAGISGAADR